TALPGSGRAARTSWRGCNAGVPEGAPMAGQPFVDFDQGLNTAINKLRDTLGDSAANPRYVETVPRRGYRFTFSLDALPEAGPVTEPAAPVLAGRVSIRRWRTLLF